MLRLSRGLRACSLVKLFLLSVGIVTVIFFLLVFTKGGIFQSAIDRSCPGAVFRYGANLNLGLDKPQSVIPRRLHQIFKDSLIPTPYHQYMLTWQRVNPGWQYFFWTDTSVKRMISEKYPQYLDLFLSYKHRLQRSDAMRYFILHQYGGVYGDLDMEALKPMESYLKSNSCILVPEPRVQTNLIFNMDTALTNCIMATTAGHPFMEHLLRSLPGAYRKVVHNWDVLHSTGPFFLNKTYTDYQSKFPACREGSSCHVHVADHKHLVPTMDVPDLKYNVYVLGLCGRRQAKSRGRLQQKACNQLISSKFKNELPPEAVTNHLWLHLGWNNNLKSSVRRKDICDLIPETITYDHMNPVRDLEHLS